MNVQAYLMGMATAGFLVAALFFLRFWTKTRDQLFATFSTAFLLLAIERFLLMYTTGDEPRTFVYMIRLVSFALITVAVIRKNREA